MAIYGDFRDYVFVIGSIAPSLNLPRAFPLSTALCASGFAMKARARCSRFASLRLIFSYHGACRGWNIVESSQKQKRMQTWKTTILFFWIYVVFRLNGWKQFSCVFYRAAICKCLARLPDVFCVSLAGNQRRKGSDLHPPPLLDISDEFTMTSWYPRTLIGWIFGGASNGWPHN